MRALRFFSLWSVLLLAIFATWSEGFAQPTATTSTVSVTANKTTGALTGPTSAATLAAANSFATYTGSETLSNKTLASPTINGATISGTFTGPLALTGNLTVNSGNIGTATATNLTLTGGSSGASLTLGQGANASATIAPSGTGELRVGASMRLYPTVNGFGGISMDTGFGTYTNHATLLLQNGAEKARVSTGGNFLIGGFSDITGSGGLKVFGTTASTSTTTGALVVGGGVGVAGSANIGATLEVGSTLTANGAIISTLTSGSPTLQSSSATTNQKFIRLANTGGDVYFGVESSVPGGYFTGSGAYDTVIYSQSNPVYIRTPALSTNGNLTVSGNSLTVNSGSGTQTFTLGDAPITKAFGSAFTAAAGFKPIAANDGTQDIGASGSRWKTFWGTEVKNDAGKFGVYGSTGADVKGTTTNDSAAAGYVGEYVSASVPSASGVSLATNTTANVTSMSLTAGDWDIVGDIGFNGSSVVATYWIGCITTTTSSYNEASSLYSATMMPSTAYSGAVKAPVPSIRLSLSGTTTVYLCARSTFSSGTQTAFGTIQARRVR